MNKFIYVFYFIVASLLFTSCSIIGGIFKAGMGVGIFLSVLVVGGIIYFMTRGSRRQ